jgi:nucleotide-binding universal stress UspA family protein
MRRRRRAALLLTTPDRLQEAIVSTILIGVDDSTHSKDAVAFGRRLAGIAGARIVLACAFPYDDRPSRAANLTYRRAVEDAATGTVDRMRHLLELPDDRVDRIVVPDPSPAHALHDAAVERRAALVVVGHTRYGRAGRIAPGATAERLLNGAPCPVAIVPDGYRERVASSMWRIGVAYVDTPEGRSALTAAAAVARACHSRLEVISAVAQHEKARDDVLAELESVVNALRTELWAEAVVLDGDPAAQLAAHSARLDLLVMGSRGYGPLRAVLAGGVSGRVAREAHCPVIVAPRGVQAPLGGLFGRPAAATA